MPHQCLNCGRIIGRGSNEILKGCSECGGKKFMFVDAPLPKEQREDLKRKADEVRDEMLKKADPDFLEMLKEKGIGNLDGAQVEMDEELGDDWVRVQMEGPGELEITEGGSDSGLEMVSPSDSRRSAKDLISQFDRELDKKKTAAPEEATKKEKAKKPKAKARKAPKGKRRAGKRKKEKQVNVINIIEQGVYEIDVKRLLEDNPIVIQKDGSYLIHLPSLFKEGREKSKK
jgi:predicted  nucleic acid-binding Zn-ribbon protein